MNRTVFLSILVLYSYFIVTLGQIGTTTTNRPSNITTTTTRYLNTTTTTRYLQNTTTTTRPPAVTTTTTRYIVNTTFPITTTTRYVSPTTTTTRPVPITTPTTTTRYLNNTTTTRYLQNTTTTTRPTAVTTTTTTRYIANTTLPVTTTTTRYVSPTTTTTWPMPITTSTTTTRAVIPGTILCNYFQLDLIYGCDMTINNPSGQEFLNIPGAHHPSRSDSSVVQVTTKFQNTFNVPLIICFRFTNLKTLEVVWSEVSLLTTDSFRHCSNLEVLDMRGNLLNIVPGNIFANARNLQVINFGRNNIESIANNVFSGTRLNTLDLGFNQIRKFNSTILTSVNSSLRQLALNGNRIRSFIRDDFSNSRFVDTLDISLNPLGNFQLGTFGLLTNLQSLRMDNCDIQQLQSNSFNELSNLRLISLNDNILKGLPLDIFSFLPTLTDISVTGNKITTIDSRSFGITASRLRTFNAQQNQLDSIDPIFFNNTQVLTDFFLNGNLCTNRNFVIGLDNRDIVRTALDVCLRNFRYVRCVYSGSANVTCGMSLRNLVGRDDIDVIEGQLPSQTTNNNVRTVTVVSGTSTIIPSVICRQFPNLNDFFASGNGITTISSTTFQNCRNLRNLQLTSQEISVIPDNTFSNLVNLERLGLSFNRIQTIPSRMFSGLGASMRELNLNSNSINKIDAGAFGSLTFITSINLSFNRLSYLNSTGFGSSLNNLVDFNGSSNQINEINPVWFNNATLLNVLNLSGNLCVNGHFTNVRNNRNYVNSQLQTCFSRFRP